MELADFHRRSSSPGLKVDRILAELSDADREVLLVALTGDPAEFPSKRLADQLSRSGHPCSNTAVTNWRAQHS